MVYKSWAEGSFCGHADVILKNKIKKLKLDIKYWSCSLLSDSKLKREAIMKRIEIWDNKAEQYVPSSSDCLSRESDIFELHKLLQLQKKSN